MPRGGERALRLKEGATVAIIGGGPAGAFAAIHLLRLARNRGLGIRVVVFEYRRRFAAGSAGGRGGDYTGCPRCAGGISPRLNDALEQLSAERANAACIQAAGLVHGGDELHFDAASARELGRRYAKAVLALQDRGGRE